MAKRKRRNKIDAKGEGPDPGRDNDRYGTTDSSVMNNNVQTRNKKDVIASSANKKNLVNSESKAAGSSHKVSTGAAAKAGKRGIRLTGKATTHQCKEEASSQAGEPRAKKMFTWSSTQEIIALAELVKSTSLDAGQPFDTSSIDWEQLAAKVGERLEHNLTRTQMYEKARRLKERYLRTHNGVGEGKPDSFKNEDEEKVYKLSRKIWGSSQAIGSQPEEECDLLSGSSEKKFCDKDNVRKGNSPPDDAEVEIPGVTVEKERPIKAHQKDVVSPNESKLGTSAAHEKANPDSNTALHSKINALEKDTQKIFEVFHAEHQALLKELEKSCVAVLQDMQVKFLSMISNTARGSQFPCVGSSSCVPLVDSIAQAPLSWDKLVDKYVSTSSNKPAAFENLYEQWQQQRLQELKLTSMKLQLMLEDCKMEQEKLEKQVSKS